MAVAAHNVSRKLVPTQPLSLLDARAMPRLPGFKDASCSQAYAGFADMPLRGVRDLFGTLTCFTHDQGHVV